MSRVQQYVAIATSYAVSLSCTQSSNCMDLRYYKFYDWGSELRAEEYGETMKACSVTLLLAVTAGYSVEGKSFY